MLDSISARTAQRLPPWRVRSVFVPLTCVVILAAAPARLRAEPAAGSNAASAAEPVIVLPTESNVAPAVAKETDIHSSTADPFEGEAAAYDPFNRFQFAPPVDAAAYFPRRPSVTPQPANYQVPLSDEIKTENRQADAPPNPCAAASEKPLGDLGINIAMPAGQVPTDYASACWDYINRTGGPLAAVRCWPAYCYQWDATCLCHRPLYFEEINLERYGYGCCACLQPAVSAAHFFGTVPALPYCMAADCPGECQYTLGHYRPGSCPPRRCHWPPCEPLAAASEAGVLTGLIFAIP